jgi:murein DD-endopeptidase MepM/ murein hydrolase activator NlpD
MSRRILAAFVAAAGFAVAVPSAADAQFRGRGGFGGIGGRGAPEAATKEGRAPIEETGLRPVFPQGVECPGIASPFASSTRYDGSPRPKFRFGGHHGGMDISLPVGTPLRAMADGELILAVEGGQMEGFSIWTRHAPEDTGLPYWLFVKYQHLSRLPTLKAGDRFEAGQVIATSGDSGTEDGHFGDAGYPHLHVTAVTSGSGDYGFHGTRVSAEHMRMIDPMAVYVRGLDDATAAKDLPDERKDVPVGYLGAQGRIHPQGARLIWPVACRMR